jgi:hypothetical protein
MSRSRGRWHLRPPHVRRPHAHQSRHHAEPGQWHFLNGLPADERLVSLGRSCPGVRSGFLETPRTRFGGVFLASAGRETQTARVRRPRWPPAAWTFASGPGRPSWRPCAWGARSGRGRCGRLRQPSRADSCDVRRLSRTSEPIQRADHAAGAAAEHVRVDLRGADVGVAKERLDGADIGTGFEQVRGETRGSRPSW